MPSLPIIGVRNDYLAIQPALEAAATEFDLPYPVLLAQCLQESSWKLQSYRYEPGYDRRYVSSSKGRATWRKDTGWLTSGPTAAAWFEAHPGRAKEQGADEWTFLAQTRIAASYGPMQLMYPTAKQLGYLGAPEGLYEPASVRFGAKLLALHYRQAKGAGWRDRGALLIALARYNGGAAGNDHPLKLRNQVYVKLVSRRYQECWGTSLLGG